MTCNTASDPKDYIEYGHWEFPFIAEATCGNYAVIQTPDASSGPMPGIETARLIRTDIKGLAHIARKYRSNWLGIDPSEVPRFMGRDTVQGDVRYPRDMTATEFFREISTLRADLFTIRETLDDRHRLLLERFELSDSRLDQRIAECQSFLRELGQQVDVNGVRS